MSANSISLRRAAVWLTLVGLTSIVAAALILAALDAGLLRHAFIRWAETKLHRGIRVDGPLRIETLSMHPRLTAERVTLANPPWSPTGATAEIEKLTLVVSLPWIGRAFCIDRLDLSGVQLHLLRDDAGVANWQLTNPVVRAGANLPLIRRLQMPTAHVTLHDERRHLRFDGTVSIGDRVPVADQSFLELTAVGTLNERPMQLELLGAPLTTAIRGAPYRFTFDERSSGSVFSGHGVLMRPFDFSALDAHFDASGADMRDLYYLTGLHLVHTAKYRLSGDTTRRGFRVTFDNLQANSGASDMSGRLAVDTANGRSKLDVELHSHVLRLADLGARATGRDTNGGQDPELMISTAALNVAAVRRADSQVDFSADTIVARHAVLTAVSAKMSIAGGHITLAPVAGGLLQGSFNAEMRVDATKDVPLASLQVRLRDLQLAQWGGAPEKQSPLDGALRARLDIRGHGNSLHEILSTADGTASIVLPAGTIRAALAEIAGVDLRGLKLLASGDQSETHIRCGAAIFDANNGVFRARTMSIDTDPVLITGRGDLRMDSESLDLDLVGQPKSLRLLRLEAPVLIRGTLKKPNWGLQLNDAHVKLVDRGLATNLDCPAVIAAADRTGGAPIQ